MEFLNGDHERKPFVYKIGVSLGNEYEVRIYIGNTAYMHEVLAFIAAIDGCLTMPAAQKIDGNGEIYWRLW